MEKKRITDEQLAVIGTFARVADFDLEVLEILASDEDASFESIMDDIDTHTEEMVAAQGIERFLCDRAIVGGKPTAPNKKPLKLSTFLPKNTVVELGAQIVEPDDELDWQESALCAQTDPEAFFPEKGGSTKDAKKVCLVCTVKEECLEYALDHDERFGIWGGLSERERRRLKKQSA